MTNLHSFLVFSSKTKIECTNSETHNFQGISFKKKQGKIGKGINCLLHSNRFDNYVRMAFTY